MAHEPVMVAEVLAAFGDGPGGWIADGTLGEAGHATAILDGLGEDVHLFGVDRDPDALAAARERLSSYGRRVILAQGNFRELPALLPAELHGLLRGILLDLGLRSTALDDPQRGFAFSREGPLDMRFDPTRGRTAADLLGRISERRLAAVLAAGTSRASPRMLARAIVNWRREKPLRTTADLVACLRARLGRRATPKLLASVFGALRMEVNGELADLDQALADLPWLLKTGGVLCVISYQSEEDRRVKRLRRATAHDPRTGTPYHLEPLTPKPLRPSAAEARRNRRARSARLRALRRMAAPRPT